MLKRIYKIEYKNHIIEVNERSIAIFSVTTNDWATCSYRVYKKNSKIPITASPMIYKNLDEAELNAKNEINNIN